MHVSSPPPEAFLELLLDYTSLNCALNEECLQARREGRPTGTRRGLREPVRLVAGSEASSRAHEANPGGVNPPLRIATPEILRYAQDDNPSKIACGRRHPESVATDEGSQGWGFVPFSAGYQSALRSFHFGLMDSIRFSFFVRSQPLMCFSRAMAARTSAKISK